MLLDVCLGGDRSPEDEIVPETETRGQTSWLQSASSDSSLAEGLHLENVGRGKLKDQSWEGLAGQSTALWEHVDRWAS